MKRRSNDTPEERLENRELYKTFRENSSKPETSNNFCKAMVTGKNTGIPPKEPKGLAPSGKLIPRRKRSFGLNPPKSDD